jgi:hypothetical protein
MPSTQKRLFLPAAVFGECRIFFAVIRRALYAGGIHGR